MVASTFGSSPGVRAQGKNVCPGIQKLHNIKRDIGDIGE